MRPILWFALAGAAAMTVYVATQGDDGDLAPQGAAHSPAKGGAGSARSRSGGNDRARPAGPVVDAKVDAAEQAWLVQSTLRWQQRLARSPAWPVMGSGQAAAWALQQPPAPPVQVPPPPPPPEAPMAPPFPHAWVGRYVDQTNQAVIAGSQQTWVVKVHDVIEGQWRVDAIGERDMQLTYLPLQQSQTVNLK